MADVDAYVTDRFSLLEVERGRLEITFAWTAYNQWNSLPKCIRNITGEIMYFKNKLDKVLAFYPDIPRCIRSDHSYDRNGRKSNSLCDYYRNVEITHVIYNIIDI